MSSEIEVTRTPRQRCPNRDCGHLLTALGGPAGQKPEAGSIIVCGYCHGVLMMKDDFTARGLTTDEMNELIADTDTMDKLAMMILELKAAKARDN